MRIYFYNLQVHSIISQVFYELVLHSYNFEWIWVVFIISRGVDDNRWDSGNILVFIGNKDIKGFHRAVDSSKWLFDSIEILDEIVASGLLVRP